MPGSIQDRIDIPTLILAAGMVLVALVATGVLLQTSGLIGRPLEDVSTKLKINSVVLDCHPAASAGNQVKRVSFVTENLPGSTDLDFADMTVNWQAGNTSVRGIKYSAAGPGPGLMGFGVRDVDGNGNPIFEVGETVEVQLDLGEEFTLGEDSEFTVSIYPKGGAGETATRTTPREITKDRYEL